MKKPIIGITCNLIYHAVGNFDGKYIIGNNNEYDLAIAQTGGTPILLPSTNDDSIIKAQVDLCDGLLLAGGDDLNPLTYGEEPTKNLSSTDWRVDHYQLQLTRYALLKKKPILGICRGMQLLNIACGGNVYQDISHYPKESIKHMQSAPRDQVCHTVNTYEKSLLHQLLGPEFFTNSFHHQVIHKLGDSIQATAWAKDNVIEGIEKNNYPFAIGVQWHPEIMLKTNANMLPLFENFISSC